MNSATARAASKVAQTHRRVRDLCCRAFQLDHRLRDNPAMRRTDSLVTHRRRGAMAFAPSDGIPAADAMVATKCSSDAQGSHIRRQRQLRLRSCRRRTMGSASVSERGMTTPRFWTVSCGPARPRALLPPVADGSVPPCRCWYPGPPQSGCLSITSPASEASAFNRMRAFVSSRAEYLPACISPSSRSRSSSLSITTYLFTAICFAVTMHLRHCGAIDSEIHRGINDGGY